MANEPATRRISIEQPFKLDKVLDGTQDFRWRRWKDAGIPECCAGT